MADVEATLRAFVEMAHDIVWCTAATVAENGEPRTRVLHPIWELDGSDLVGWVATSPLSPKARHLEHNPRLSCTYWAANHDTCTADCDTEWVTDSAGRQAGWQRFLDAPEPLGYDPSMISGWTDPETPSFGILKLKPRRLRVMPGTVLAGAGGELMTWQRP